MAKYAASILTRVAGFVVAAEQEYRVISAGGNGQQREQVDREGRKAENAVIDQKTDDPADRPELDSDHGHDEDHRDEGPVYEEQHRRDHHPGDQGDPGDTLSPASD